MKSNPFIDFTKWLLKWAAIILVSLIGVGILIVFGILFSNWYGYERHASKVQAVVKSEFIIPKLDPTRVRPDKEPVAEALKRGIITLPDFRKIYPEYQDMSDTELAHALHKKFFPDMPQDDFFKKIKFSGGSNKSTYGCSTDFPIMVAFVNNSSKTLENIDIELEAYLPGRSTNILEWGGNKVSYDYITKPGEGRGSCRKGFKVKDEYINDPELSEAIYKGKVTYVRFSK